MYDIENYYNAETIKEAVTLLKEHPEARIISGGSDVLIKIREGKLAGTSLVCIRDIKELKEQLNLRKQCLRVIAQYQKDFTEEGVPVDANADLSAYQDCETMTLPAQQVAEQLLASQEEGGSMEDFSDEELQKLLYGEEA